MIGIQFWRIGANGVRHSSVLAGPFLSIKMDGLCLFATLREAQHPSGRELIAVINDNAYWCPKAPYFPESDLGIYDHFDIEPWPKEASPRLTFGDLKRGDKFISFPVDGDNQGHGGYLGSEYLFVVTQEARAMRGGDPANKVGLAINISRGVESTCPHGMEVLKIE